MLLNIKSKPLALNIYKSCFRMRWGLQWDLWSWRTAAQPMGLSCYAFTAIKISLSALLWHSKRRMLPLQPHPVHVLAPCLLLRHQASLIDQHSLEQESLWVQLLLKCFGAVTFTWQQPYRAHLDQHFREHLTVSKHQPEAARGVGALTSSWRVAQAGGI